jgi:hypothetical protein
VLVAFFGEEQLVESGLEATRVAPLPIYLELLAGIFNGDNDVAFGRGSLTDPLVTGRLRTFIELGDLGGLQLGTSVAWGENPFTRRVLVWGGDPKYKLTPAGWRHPLLTLAGEALWMRRLFKLADEPTDAGIEDFPPPNHKKERRRFGWYAYGEVQPWKRWAGGLRVDSTQYPDRPGRAWAVEPYLSFMPSEFLRFPPSPAHVAELIRRIRTEGIRVVIGEPWADRRLLERIAREGGARAVVLAHQVGALPGAASYLELLEYNVRALADALR